MSVAHWSLADLRTAYLSHTDHIPPAITAPHSDIAGAVGPSAVGVLGVSGGVGTTTVALALAEALQVARLVELAAPHASGLAGAAPNELGDHDGWRIGMRGDLELARNLHTTAPTPSLDVAEAVVDLGSWTGDVPSFKVDRLVVVASCSVPGIRRLDACLRVLESTAVLVPVVTRAGRTLPREVVGAASPMVRAAITSGVLHVVPECRGLSLTGLTPDRLPRSLQRSAAGLAPAVKDSSS